MQLGTSTIPLLPAAAVGVAVVMAGLVLWGVYRVRRASGAGPRPTRPDGRVEAEPDARDWTGEAAGGAADPPRPARPLTVADAVAVRGADTEPMAAVRADGPRPGDATGRPPVETSSRGEVSAPREDGRLGAERSALGTGGGAAEYASSGEASPRTGSPGAVSARDEVGRHGPERSVLGTGEGSAGNLSSGEAVSRELPPVGGVASTSRPDADDSVAPPASDAAAADRTDDVTDGSAPAIEEDAGQAADGPGPVRPGPVPPPWSSARSTSAAGAADAARPAEAARSANAAGSAEPVSLAVRQALAARAVQRARGRADVPDPGAEEMAPSVPDARDRLLSVLLTDPAAAVGATTDLDDTRARIDRIGDLLRRRRAELAAAVHRLHACGLTGEQIGKLAGLDGDDVREILEQPSGEGSGGPR